jgi:hypothetical protein
METVLRYIYLFIYLFIFSFIHFAVCLTTGPTAITKTTSPQTVTYCFLFQFLVSSHSLNT